MRQQQHFQQERPRRFWWVLLIFLACLAGTIFYVLPLLSSVGNTSSPNTPGGWSDAQQRQVAFDMAQNLQNRPNARNDKTRANHGLGHMETLHDGTVTPYQPDAKSTFPGFNNDTADMHSETI